MFNGKMKAVTFSYDDGVMQDKRLIKLFDKYNLKGTFNLNSEKLGTVYRAEYEGKKIVRYMVEPGEVREVYRNHEVAVHTLTHPKLTECDAKEIVRQVEQDRQNLSKLVGYDVIGMAYPGGGINNDERVADIIKRRTKIQYARTTTSTLQFDLQSDLYRFNPSVHHSMNFDELCKIGRKFVELQPTSPQIFYIWGHSYEFDEQDTWDKMEQFCQLIANRDDIFYGTNREVLL